MSTAGSLTALDNQISNDTEGAASPLHRALLGEVMGTFILVFIGTGCVAAAVLTDAQIGLWQVAVVWGFGVTLAIYGLGRTLGCAPQPRRESCHGTVPTGGLSPAAAFALLGRTACGRHLGRGASAAHLLVLSGAVRASAGFSARRARQSALCHGLR